MSEPTIWENPSEFPEELRSYDVGDGSVCVSASTGFGHTSDAGSGCGSADELEDDPDSPADGSVIDELMADEPYGPGEGGGGQGPGECYGGTVMTWKANSTIEARVVVREIRPAGQLTDAAGAVDIARGLIGQAIRGDMQWDFVTNGEGCDDQDCDAGCLSVGSWDKALIMRSTLVGKVRKLGSVLGPQYGRFFVVLRCQVGADYKLNISCICSDLLE